MIQPHPFIKWLGGKRKMLSNISNHLPDRCNTYYEPMIGGGAIFFALAKENRFENAVISDLNPELTNAWKVIQGKVAELISELKDSKYIYDKNAFLEIRKDESGNDVQLAARFIYLNKTCFNGLYRVNKSGHFNTPFGKYHDPVICDDANLLAVSNILQKVEIKNLDFEEVVSDIKPGDAVYFDPPYLPISETANFDRYTSTGFGISDHHRLAEVFSSLAERGITAVLSNSVSQEAVKLYRKFDFDFITGNRSIGGSSSSRKTVSEMIVFSGKK